MCCGQRDQVKQSGTVRRRNTLTPQTEDEAVLFVALDGAHNKVESAQVADTHVGWLQEVAGLYGGRSTSWRRASAAVPGSWWARYQCCYIGLQLNNWAT